MRRHLILPSQGTLLVNTDLHGNLDDFLAMHSRFEEERDAHWVILGDVVHGPDDRAREDEPDLYGYPDRSFDIVERIAKLRSDRVHYVLGNHDHGHVGGPRPAKFHGDEVSALEATLSESQRALLRELFETAFLAIAAPCGLLLTHGAAGDGLDRLADLDRVSLDPAKNDARTNEMLRSLLSAYGQRADVTARMLERVSRSSGLELRVVVHGHDRDESGWFAEGDNQLVPVIFGAPRENKRYLRVDLSARYRRAADLRDCVEILRLHATRR